VFFLVAGHTVISQILDGLDRIGNMTDPFGLLVMAGSYEPFMSLFNIAGVTVNHPEVEGIGRDKLLCLLAAVTSLTEILVL